MNKASPLVCGIMLMMGTSASISQENGMHASVYYDANIRSVSKNIYVAIPPAGKVTPQREPSIDQEKLVTGKYSLGTVLEAGQNQFNLPFTKEHGHGEGDLGPRHKQREVWNSRGGTVDDPQAWPFLRVNGIDSQSCFECHSTIGSYTAPGSMTSATVRKPGAQGGPAGAANTAFINDQFPEDLSELLGDKPTAVLTKFARNPPHVFGTGYTQRLATEMTTDLLAQAQATMVSAQSNLNIKKTIALESKGASFGNYTVICAASNSCTIDNSAVVGVQKDLVVRPFQWGGIASSVRHFVRDALDFHFSVQAVEKVGNKDCDLDGMAEEITVGNVSALTSYVTMFRPPAQQIKKGKEASVAAGEKLMREVGCTSCHSESLTMENPILTIMTPPPVSDSSACPQEVAQLTNSLGHDSHSLAEAKHRISEIMQGVSDKSVTPQAIYGSVYNRLHNADMSTMTQGNYHIDLNLTGVPKDSVPAYVWPRLPVNKDQKVEVPLFSDLKLHYMGARLADRFAQPTDNEKYSAQPGYYVTRVLWGIADSDPYMHDGRARSLIDAIELHATEGSDAKAVADEFFRRPSKQQQNILDFLGSLTLPIAEGTNSREYVQHNPAN